jgi:hypothetical protein
VSVARSVTHLGQKRGVPLVFALVSFGGGMWFLAGGVPAGVESRALEIATGIMLLVIARAAAVGFLTRAKIRRGGDSTVALVALSLAACFWWTGVVPTVALPVAGVAILRSRRARQPQHG